MKTRYLFLIIMLFAGKVFSQDFSATLDSSEMLIGSRATLTLRAKSINNIVFPVIKDSLSNLKVLSKSKIDTLDDNTLHQRIILTALDSGTYSISPLVFIEIDKQQNSKVHITKALSINIKSPDISKMKDINTIKPARTMQRSIWEYWYYVAIPLLLIIALVIYLKFFKKKKVTPIAVEEKREIVIDPKAWLNDELNSLKSRQLWLAKEYKQHFSLLSDALRRYFELKFSIPTMEETTPNIAILLKTRIEESELETLMGILNQADLVKFAKHTPSDEDAMNTLNAAISLSEKI